MSDQYILLQDQDGQWISAPNNGCDIGDMLDVVGELNKLMYERDEVSKQRDSMANALRYIAKDSDGATLWRCQYTASNALKVLHGGGK